MTGLDEHQARPDALHTQRDHADFLITGKNPHDIILPHAAQAVRVTRRVSTSG
jgi:hypothetical protein